MDMEWDLATVGEAVGQCRLAMEIIGDQVLDMDLVTALEMHIMDMVMADMDTAIQTTIMVADIMNQDVE